MASAIELADAEGLDAVSMSRLADRLGSAPMSLYRHVAKKEELLLLMHDTVWAPPEIPTTDADWRTGLGRWARAQHDVLRAHLWLERVRLGERAGTPSQLMWMEWGLRVLDPTPLGARDKVEVLLVLSGHVMWEARFHAETTLTAQADGSSAREAAAEFGQLIASVASPDRFPALRRAVDAGAFVDMDPAFATFQFGLERLLDGVDHLILAATPR